LLIIVLCLLLPAGAGLAEQGPPFGDPFDDAEAYVQALTDAMDARYGGRDAWPQGFDTYLALARYYSGIETAYTPTLAWAPGWIQMMEASATSGRTDQPAAAEEFLRALKDLLKPTDLFDPFGWSRPYEAKALISAVFTYSGNADSSDYAALPSDDDLPQEDAIAIARETIQNEYGLSDDDIDQLPAYTQFCVGDWFGTPFWGVVFGLNDLGYEHYYAYIASPAGEVIIAVRNDGSG